MKYDNLIGKTIPVTVNAKYIQGDFQLAFEKYVVDQKLCINLADLNGSQMARVTVNIDDSLEDDEFHFKSWSENDGLLESLVESGHIIDTGKFSETGFVKAPICRLSEILFSDEAG